MARCISVTVSYRQDILLFRHGSTASVHDLTYLEQGAEAGAGQRVCLGGGGGAAPPGRRSAFSA